MRQATTPQDLESANHLIAEAFDLPAPLVDTALRPSILDRDDVAVELVVDGRDREP